MPHQCVGIASRVIRYVLGMVSDSKYDFICLSITVNIIWEFSN